MLSFIYQARIIIIHMALACSLALIWGCDQSQIEPVHAPKDARVRSEIESEFQAELRSHPPTTTVDMGVDGPIRLSPSPIQWGLANRFESGIDIGWHARTEADNLPPIRIAIIDESFDVQAAGLTHAFNADDGINLLHPDQPLWTAHRDGFHHGNMVASIIANRPTGELAPLGVLGNQPVELIPIVAAGGGGPAWRTPRATPEMILQGLRHALDAKASIINISAGVEISPGKLKSLCSHAIWDQLEEANVLVVCAAGNTGHDIDQQPVFPASVDRSNVVAVMGVGPTGDLAIRHDSKTGDYELATNWGVKTVDFAAPGEVIEVMARADRPELVDGTSAAAAFVTAILAIDRDPGLLAIENLASRCRKGGLIQLPSAP